MSKLRIRNVRLSSKDNRSYRERCAYHATLRRIESGEREADTRRHVTAWAEQVACRIIAQQHEQDRRNIISWEELTVYGHYARKYKETDGIFKLDQGSMLLEVKASTSPASIRKGRKQLNENLSLLDQTRDRFSGMLVLFDCSQLSPEFAAPAQGTVEHLKNSGEYGIVQGLDWALDPGRFSKWLWLVDAQGVEQIISRYGPPAEIEAVSTSEDSRF
ncbi:hypothetical protein [Malikia sp.]|uniref:hypothetical protein n=1 Tax=Malikia sp. TaxID=2070706 RepID=UPI0026038D59|nr:hypothetical protein [Malikia sp.]MDD2728414.1 hypothetical protein [Malikia sp.]